MCCNSYYPVLSLCAASVTTSRWISALWTRRGESLLLSWLFLNIIKGLWHFSLGTLSTNTQELGLLSVKANPPAEVKSAQFF